MLNFPPMVRPPSPTKSHDGKGRANGVRGVRRLPCTWVVNNLPLECSPETLARQPSNYLFTDKVLKKRAANNKRKATIAAKGCVK